MKLSLLLLVLAGGVAVAADPEMKVIPDQSPSIVQPSGWSYGSSPGTYFWNGFRCGAVVAVTGLVFSMFRGAFTDREDL